MDIIPLQECKATELPILSRLSEGELKACIKSNKIPKIGNYTCHTQSVERCVKLFTEASALVCEANC